MKYECPPLDEHTTKSMKSNKRKDTQPEMVLRKALREAGFAGYRLQWKVPGRPDICYPGRKVAIFVNGCFWHRCPHCNLGIPKHNREYWEDKFQSNIERDHRNQMALTSLGWTVVVIWECELKRDPDAAVGKIVKELRKADSRKVAK